MKRRSAGNALVYAFLGVVSLVSVFPLLWAALSSLKTEQAIFAYPPKLLPDPATLANYAGVLLDTDMPRFFGNSVLVTGATLLLTLAVAFMGAYAVSRTSFRGKEVLLFGLLATAMIPGIATLIPLYLLAKQVGLYDTYLGLVLVYSAWQAPVALWLLRGFIDAIPREVEEAAALDGLSRFAVMWRIVLPLLRPGLLAAGVMIFVYVWNDFLIAVALTTSESRRLLQVGLYRFYSDTNGIVWGRFMAYTMLGSLPVVAAFLALNRRFIEGMVRGSVKG